MRRKVRDTEDVETESSIVIDAGTPANDPSKSRGAMVVRAETRSSRMAHDVHSHCLVQQEGT